MFVSRDEAIAVLRNWSRTTSTTGCCSGELLNSHRDEFHESIDPKVVVDHAKKQGSGWTSPTTIWSAIAGRRHGRSV
jgi:hypothetical protein